MPPRSDASSASMNSTFSLSSSNISSPSRHSPARKSPRSNGVVTPQVKPFNYESPSRPITSDYEEMLGRSEREYRKKLDEEEAERARLYRAQVAKAAAERYRVNEDCGLEIERLKLEEETEDMRRRAAQEKEVQRLKVQKQKEQAEARQRELEAKLREEQIAREAAENQRKQQEAEERVRAEKERAETAQRKQEQDERKAKEVAAAPPPPARPVQPTLPAQASPAPAVAAAPVAPITAATQSASSPPSRDIVRVHEKYLALHRNMKQFRKQLLEAHKAAGSPLKKFIGEIRRNMVKRMGQLTIDVKDSKVVATRIRSECFDEAINANGPKIDIRPFLVSHQIANDADAHYPALLLYAWICFEKNLIAQWYNEASKEDGRIIQQLSLVAASMYLDPKYMCNGSIPMSDTLLAKLHRICPVMPWPRQHTQRRIEHEPVCPTHDGSWRRVRSPYAQKTGRKAPCYSHFRVLAQRSPHLQYPSRCSVSGPFPCLAGPSPRQREEVPPHLRCGGNGRSATSDNRPSSSSPSGGIRYPRGAPRSRSGSKLGKGVARRLAEEREHQHQATVLTIDWHGGGCCDTLDLVSVA
ncbi:hypothetical protein BU23DRAFT_556971 [Bimuria novae-zelandiae CBS 107.79]|uniref:mRNA export factor GLE1 n=1 Tax=Bimuria novae-zelandiae CBS 107.79 TaxID=1447943 RepID=A0A6A5VAJ4_9PLEO|nr:hypothetical protein BU23DRAFT_556971 [Bimuria novae-zelandiae CBS 107.79]